MSVWTAVKCPEKSSIIFIKRSGQEDGVTMWQQLGVQTMLQVFQQEYDRQAETHTHTIDRLIIAFGNGLYLSSLFSYKTK